jgi:hypothetical protein
MNLTSKGRAGGALGVVLIGGAFILGACGSSSPSGANTGTSSTAGTTSTSSSGGGSDTTTSSAPSSGGGNSISQIESKLNSSSTATYDAKYTVSGTADISSLEVAEQAPSSFAFLASTSSGKEDLFGDTSKTTACSQSSGSSTWQCEDLGTGLGSFAAELNVFTGKHWSQILAAGGVTGASTSTMTVAGVASDCVTYNPNTSVDGEICVASDSGILTYVKDLKTGSTFSLTSYSSSPAASLFQPPAGATVNTLPPGVTIPSIPATGGTNIPAGA